MSAPSNSGNHQASKTTLWIGDIESWMDEAHVANLFSTVGQVVNVKIKRDRSSGTPMGYGFVEFTTPEIAARVLQLYNGSINPATQK